MKDHNKKCRTCKFCREVRCDWPFFGCFCEPHKGKWIAEIEICPLESGTQPVWEVSK